ncbi:MAG: DsbA family protein [Candidatus Aenigmarchaeota archaeon]|nr:DsbA family protein [Candidatus Aenigmarchaeota archaeon]
MADQSKTFAIMFVAALLGSYAGGSLSGFAVSGNAVGQVAAAPTPTPTPTPTAAGTIALAGLEDNDPVLGSDDAPVTIIEFSDFQCPFCGRFYDQTELQLKQDYVDTGKLRIIYRDFPLSFHPEAQPAAEAAECANEQGKFWEFHDKIFENQATMSAAAYKQWASDLGMNVDQFTSCVETGKYRSEVQADLDAGVAAGVSGTPTVFVGKTGGQGVKIVGAQPYDTFKGAIESFLAA